MSTYETSRVLTGDSIPVGYEITAHELRGYDSPDRWYEVHHLGKRVGEYGTAEEALDACLSRSRHDASAYVARHAARLMMEALWLVCTDHITTHEALVLVGLEES